MPLHLRSTRPSFPSPPPRRGWQRSNHCPQSFGPRITRQPVRVGTPGHRRARSGSASPSSILLHEPSEMPQECACSSPGRNLSPKGVARWRASATTRSPSKAGNAALACVAARPAARPQQLAGLPAPARPGCQPWLKSVRGSAPHNPGRRRPSRVGVGGEVEGRHGGAVQGRRALRGCLASPGEVVGVGASRWPGVTARQDLVTRGQARRR